MELFQSNSSVSSASNTPSSIEHEAWNASVCDIVKHLPEYVKEMDEIFADLTQSDVTQAKEGLDESSTNVNSPDAFLTSTELSYPHVPVSVEEVSLVLTLEQWSNRNVRVIGLAFPQDESDATNEWKLISIAEDGGPYSIALDVSLLSFDPPKAVPLQVFAELEMIPNRTPPTPCLKAKFFRRFDSVDLVFYRQALEVQKQFIPLFVNRH